MKKFLLMITLVASTTLFTACGDDGWHDDWRDNNGGWRDDGGNNGGQGDDNNQGGDSQQLNSYETSLVGSYAGSYTTDDKTTVTMYLVLNKDRSGYIKSVENSTTSTLDIEWYANASQIAFYYSDDDSDRDIYDYSKSSSYLTINGIQLSPYSGEITTTSPLIGQWQGTIKDYYNAMFGLSDGSYKTIIEYANDGYGAQLDYDVADPQGNYSYKPFQWNKGDNAITMVYEKDDTGYAFPTATISNYALTSSNFSGQVAYGTSSFAFDYSKTSAFDWTPYTRATATTSAKSLLRQLMSAKAKPTAKGSFAK